MSAEIIASGQRNASDELAVGTGYILEAVSSESVLIGVNLRINCIPEPCGVDIGPERELIRRLTQIHADGINTGSRFYLNDAGTFASERRNASDALP
jgi:hypothetical protein